MTLWMEVTMDDLELPVIVADSLRELARKAGKSPNNIASGRYHARIRGHRQRYVKVEVEDGED